jgi:hypothetical protein
MFLSSCDQLDDYLARGLGEEQERAFEAHLPECPACYTAVQQQNRLDALLVLAVTKLDQVPVELIHRTRARLQKLRRRRYLAYALSASAAAALVWFLLQLPTRPPTRLKDGSRPPGEVVAESEKESPDPVRISFSHESKLLLVPEETGSPDVTFVWVYPNLRSAHLASADRSESPNLERKTK